MIRFADDSTSGQVRDMWKTCFGDPDNYMDVYFSYKYRNENTLLYIEDSKPVASLQMLFYTFTFHGVEIPIIYLSGLCTLPEYRSRGYMKQLIIRSYQVANDRGVPLMVLVPQDEGVMDYYSKFGFVKTFDAGTEELPSLSKIIKAAKGDIHKAYDAFDAYYRSSDMTVQKTLTDFEAIIEEAKLFNYPPKRNLTGMARLIDVKQLISIFSDRYSKLSFVISVEDELINDNSSVFYITKGKVGSQEISKTIEAESNIEVNIGELAQLLLGYHTSEKAEPFKTLFPEKEPAMHFMLE